MAEQTGLFLGVAVVARIEGVIVVSLANVPAPVGLVGVLQLLRVDPDRKP